MSLFTNVRGAHVYGNNKIRFDLTFLETNRISKLVEHQADGERKRRSNRAK